MPVSLPRQSPPMSEVRRVTSGGVSLHTKVEGQVDGPCIVFANSLGTTLEIWDNVLSHLPPGLRIIRYDKRGHGRSDVPDAPYTMGQLISDAEAVCDAHNVRDAVFVGLSVGGMIAQGLAIKRLDLVRAMVLSNTAAKIGTPALWSDRIAAIERDGLEAHGDAIMDRWFGPDFRNCAGVTRWRNMLTTTPLAGYLGTCAAIAGTDFYTPTSGLRLPTLGIAGTNDQATPPDLVRETTDLIPGSAFALLRRAGHLPCVEQPEVYAGLLGDFLMKVGHM